MGADKSTENTPNTPKNFGPICLPKPKNLGFGYKGLVLLRLINRKHGQGTYSTIMGADKSTENTPNLPKFICQNFLPKPQSL